MTKVTVILTSSQPWICPAMVTHADAIVIGGGASGAPGHSNNSPPDGYGGSAGQQISALQIVVVPNQTYNIVVGNGGPRVYASAYNNTQTHNAGGESSAFGLSANGGGTGSPSSTGEKGYGSDITGEHGGPGDDPNYDSSGPGGSGYGAGGGGGSRSWSETNTHGGYGGQGATGAVIITYYLPDVSFSADSTSGLSPKTITFTGTGTETPTGWYWDFGDGETSDVQNPSHTYTTTGKKTVSLTVTNAYSVVTLTKTDYITLLWKPTSHAALIDSDPWRR